MAYKETRDEAEAEGVCGAVESIRCGGTEARDETQHAAFRQGAAYDEHPDGAHGGGDGETDGGAAQEEFHGHLRISRVQKRKTAGAGGFLISVCERAQAGPQGCRSARCWR